MLEFEMTMMPWIGRTMKVIDYFIMDRFHQKGIDLTKVQWILLRRLRHMNGETQHNLAFLTNRDKASLTRLLTTMEKKKLVARIPSKSDHRTNHVYITTQGEKILRKAQPVIDEMIREMQEGITEQESMAVIEVLKKVINNIKSEDLVAIETK